MSAPTTLYVVTDCGSSSPTYGFICGVYDTLDAAENRLKEVKASDDFRFMDSSEIEDMCVREFVLNQPSNG